MTPCKWMQTIAISYGEKTSFCQCLRVRLEVAFEAPRPARLLVDGSFGLGEILWSLQIFKAATLVSHCECSQTVAFFHGRMNLIPQGLGVSSEVAFWGSKDRQSASWWKLCSGRNPALFVNLGGGAPLSPSATGHQQSSFSMRKIPHSPSV